MKPIEPRQFSVMRPTSIKRFSRTKIENYLKPLIPVPAWHLRSQLESDDPSNQPTIIIKWNKILQIAKINKIKVAEA